MATGWPMKTTYADGDVYAAQDVNDITGTINLLGSSVAYAAGKNKIINGDFSINQRGFTSVTTSQFGFDRFFFETAGGGTATYSAQTFTPGAAPVAGYEAINFMQIVTTGQSAASDFVIIAQKIEDVRTFAGQTFTVSFWAKADSGTPGLSAEPTQVFGSGGSTQVRIQGQKIILSTSWTRYSLTFSAPSISGKTIGTGNNLHLQLFVSAGSDRNARLDNLGNQNNTFQLWGVQVEAGSTATAFQTATGTIQGELAACQRYFERTSVGSNTLIWTVASGGGYFSYYWQVAKRNTSGTATLQQSGMYISAGTLSVAGANSTDSIGFLLSTAGTVAFNTGYAQIDNEL